MKFNLLFIVLICLFQFSAFAQSKVIYKSNSDIVKPVVTEQSTAPHVLTAEDKEQMEREKKEGKSTEPVFTRKPDQRVQKAKPAITTGVQRADAKYGKTPKTKVNLSPKKAKTTAQEITDIEREIVRVSNSDDPEKVIRIQKMEKLLEKKKLEKFSNDQSN